MVTPPPLAWDCIGGQSGFIGQSGYGFWIEKEKVKIIPKFPQKDFKKVCEQLYFKVKINCFVTVCSVVASMLA